MVATDSRAVPAILVEFCALDGNLFRTGILERELRKKSQRIMACDLPLAILAILHLWTTFQRKHTICTSCFDLKHRIGPIPLVVVALYDAALKSTI